jgi:CheY-like chemotaxis protein/HPt (histidine-containing phosphotransfer) domain-containing protein
VVEDHPTNQKVTERYLKKAGYKVDIAGNGKLGEKAFKRKQYDLILMDMQMPVMDGYEASAKIRAYEQKHAARNPQPATRVPIIAMTAHAASGDREKCLGAGADDYIAKPMSREELLDMVAKWSISKKESGKADEVTEQKKPDDKTTEGDAPMNLEWALDLYDGDKEFLMEVLHEFLEKTGNQIESIRQAISGGDAEVVRREGHSIKGGAAILTANDISGLAYKLQEIGESGDLDSSTGTLEKLEAEFHRLENYVKVL